MNKVHLGLSLTYGLCEKKKRKIDNAVVFQAPEGILTYEKT